MAINLLTPCKRALKLAERNDAHMSSYYPLVVALRKELMSVLGVTDQNEEQDEHDEDQDQQSTFDAVMGAGTGLAVWNRIVDRFNMQGEATGTRRVGLLDQYQLWSFHLDPFAGMLCKHVIPADHTYEVQDALLDWAVPEHDCGLSSRLETKLTRFVAHAGEYRKYFKRHPPAIVQDVKDMNLDHVAEWMSLRQHTDRLTFWETFLKEDILYTHVASKLVSLRSVGSMSVERAAKPLKHYVYTPERNRLAQGKAEMLLRTAINLRFLKKLEG